MQLYPWMAVFFVCFIGVTSFVLLNMVVAMIVEDAMKKALESDDEIARAAREELRGSMRKLFAVFLKADKDGNKTLGKDEFLDVLKDLDAQGQMHAMGIDLEDAEEIFDLIDFDRSGELDCEEFIEGCLRTRGHAKARHLMALGWDIVAVKHQVTDLSNSLSLGLSGLEGRLGRLEACLLPPRALGGASAFPNGGKAAAFEEPGPEASNSGPLLFSLQRGSYGCTCHNDELAQAVHSTEARLARMEVLLEGCLDRTVGPGACPRAPSAPTLPLDDYAKWVDPC